MLERPETREADTGPEMFHYVRKDKIAESAIMGTYVIALCGETFPVTKTPKPGSPVCPPRWHRSARAPPGCPSVDRSLRLATPT